MISGEFRVCFIKNILFRSLRMSRSFSGGKVILGGGNNIHEKVMVS